MAAAAEACTASTLFGWGVGALASKVAGLLALVAEAATRASHGGITLCHVGALARDVAALAALVAGTLLTPALVCTLLALCDGGALARKVARLSAAEACTTAAPRHALLPCLRALASKVTLLPALEARPSRHHDPNNCASLSLTLSHKKEREREEGKAASGKKPPTSS